jgi:hypothetical protein
MAIVCRTSTNLLQQVIDLLRSVDSGIFYLSEYEAYIDDIIKVKFKLDTKTYSVTLAGHSCWHTFQEADHVTLPQFIAALETQDLNRFGLTSFTYQRS